MKYKKYSFKNNFFDWGQDGSEFWWPTLIWLKIEIQSFEYFVFCIDFHDLSFEFRLFGIGFNLDLWRDERKFYFQKSIVLKGWRTTQVTISCAMYWHFFELFDQDDADEFIEFFGQRITKEDTDGQMDK